MLKKCIATAFLVFAGAFNVTAVNATATWDATNDFTPETTTNPNSVRSYGYNPASVAGYQFKEFNQLSTYGSAIPIWLDGTYISLTSRHFLKT